MSEAGTEADSLDAAATYTEEATARTIIGIRTQVIEDTANRMNHTQKCYYCEASVVDTRRWCDSSCRDLYLASE